MSLHVLDTDVLTELLAGDAALVARLAAVPVSERAISDRDGLLLVRYEENS